MATALSPIQAGIDPEFMRKAAPELARDIVAKIDVASALAAAAGLTPEQWETLRHWPGFQDLVKQAMTEMSGSLGVHERIKRKAAMVLDQVGVLDAATIAGDPKVNPTARMTALDFLRDCAEVGGKAKTGFNGGGGGGGGPLIVINLPNQQLAFDPGQPAIEHDANG
jgi:hypothetical protein